MPQLIWLEPDQPPEFPPTWAALDHPNGLLAAGGDLTPPWLLLAYRHGIFPWFNAGEPILWWSPSPRMVLEPGGMHVSRSLKKAYRRDPVTVTINTAFSDVIQACQAPRDGQPGTWITEEMRAAYETLNQLGWAHSIEVWSGDQLVGGLYGIGIDRVFFGESMFSRQTNGSKIALLTVSEWARHRNMTMIDCQVYNDHLNSLGAHEIERNRFEQRLPRDAVPLQAPDSELLNNWVRQRLATQGRSTSVEDHHEK